MADVSQLIKELKNQVTDLNSWANILGRNKEAELKGKTGTLMSKINQIDDALFPTSAASDTSGTPSDLEPGEVHFGNFLSEIGDSIVETQQQLDRQSMQYLQSIHGQPHIQPAVFRIPKVSADIKFGMRKSEGKGFNILISKKSVEDETSLNQSMQFEILSVPPPPDFQQRAFEQVPTTSFVYSPATRDAIFRDLKDYKVKDGQTGMQSEKEILIKNRKQVLILQMWPNTQSDFEIYIMLFAADDPEKQKVGAWFLNHDPSKDRDVDKIVFEAIIRLNLSERGGVNYKALYEFVLWNSRLQQNVLQ